MTLQYSPKKNPRVIIIQKLYSKYYNNEEILIFPKHRFKKFIKDVVNGTVEREDLINEEIKNHLDTDLNMKNLDKIFQVIIKSAIFEFLYKPKTSIKIIIKEYLNASNFFIEESQTKYLNALLDKISKKIRSSNG
jgi:N utilization substance protein B